MSDQELFENLVLNLMMGATLGAVFIIALLFLDAHDISNLLRHSTYPIAATTILVAAPLIYFAFGAALTGAHFAIRDGNCGSGG